MKYWVMAVCLGMYGHLAMVQAAETAGPVPLSVEERRTLEEEVKSLRQELQARESAGSNLPVRVDIEIGIDAVDRSLHHEELDQKGAFQQARQVLSLSRERIASLSEEAGARSSPRETVQVMGYRSALDATAQPYALALPASYQDQGSERYPVYVVLHGRSNLQSEVPFIARWQGRAIPADQTWIQLDVFGRGNNGYRYAGEVDVFEALSDVIRRFRVDEERIVLWGFSMGGAGAWHLGLHTPARWCAVGAGAGFVDFYKYQKVEQPLPWYQDLTLRIYDSTHYVTNLENVPFVTYGGEKDAQLLASTTMRDLAGPLKVPLEVIIGPNMGHAFDESSRQSFMAFLARHARAGRRKSIDRRQTRFITSTVKYNECDWFRIEEQIVPLDVSTVEASIADDGSGQLRTENVAALSVSRSITDQLSIDDSPRFELTGAADGLMPDVYFVQEDDQWRMLDYEQSQEFLNPEAPRKRRGLQGPIDDAFTGAFLCVRGTGPAWSPTHQEYANWSLVRFEQEYSKWFRGRVRVVNDTELTEDQVESNHLILFGDPGSNSILGRVVKDLPLQWSQTEISFGGTAYNPDLYCLCLVYPNPLNRSRYVVLNSGHTFHERDFRASNAQLYPRLGDAGVVRFRRHTDGQFEEEIDLGEIFDSSWALEE